MTLLVERESFAAMVATILLVLLLIVLRVSLRSYGRRRQAVHEARIREQAFKVSFNASE